MDRKHLLRRPVHLPRRELPLDLGHRCHRVVPPILDKDLIRLAREARRPHHEQARHAALVMLIEHQALVGLLREAGATEVHARLSAPPFLYPCYFGTDIDSSDYLIAYNHSLEEIREIIGVDSLGYLNADYLDKLADNSTIGFCKGCFTGEYPCEPPCRAQKSKFEQKIGREGAK